MTNLGAVPAALVLDFAMHGCSMKEAFLSLQRSEVGVLVVLGLLNGIEFGLNNLAIMYLQVAMRTMVLSSNVLLSMITCRLWGLELCGVGKMFSLVFLMAGGMCQGLSIGKGGLDVESQIIGSLLQLGSMIMSCQRWAGLQWIMQRLDPESALRRLSKMQLMIAMSLVSGPQCLAMSVFLEGPDIEEVNVLILRNVAILSTTIVVMVSAELQLLHLTSAVAVAVLSPLHTIPIVIGGVLLFHDRVFAINVAGFCLSFVGACVYALARRREKDVPESLGNFEKTGNCELDDDCLRDEGQQPGLVAKVVGRVRFRPSQAREWKPFESPDDDEEAWEVVEGGSCAIAAVSIEENASP
eukprot:CAMPEP_0194496848 /NCGR_PEP_ID=MMETSP0253-20130528/13980_1 /TAXON_ID=2966 /ORGANISM="Noctiluca scintillans" /LENGTH=353 /DNA_ID=CAMNT_0039338291 /DNA_START=116 /DNA_END=1173 /DNA_ORIENTATION=+